MERNGFAERPGLALAATAGLSLFLITSLVYARLTGVDPFLPLLGGSRKLANGAAFVHLLALEGYWAVFLGPRLTGRTGAWIAGTFLASTILAFVWARWREIPLYEALHFDIGRHAWWIAIVLALVSAVFTLRRWKRAISGPWRIWGLVGLVSFCVGLTTHILADMASGRSDPLMLAKIVSILLLPTTCLLGVALRFDGPRGRVIRLLFALGALVGIAVATVK